MSVKRIEDYFNEKTEKHYSFGEVKPLPPLLPGVPSMPAELIPAQLRSWITDVAERACAPLEMVAVPVPVAVGTVIGRRIAIRPGQYDDFEVVPNLWGGVVARPGMMKTSLINEAMNPLKRLVAEARAEYEENNFIVEAEEVSIKTQIETVKNKMKNVMKKGNMDMVDDLKQQLIDLNKELQDNNTTEKRYFTQDATIEKLGELLQENPTGLLILRDELAGWLRTMDKQGREGDREFYLESWNGNGSYTFDRIGRGTIHIPAVTLSIFGGIQPGKLKAYIDGAIDGAAGADGLLQRIQLLVWPDELPEWKRSDRYPDGKAKDRAYQIFQNLDRLTPESLGAEEPTGKSKIPFLRFDDEAQGLFDSWRDELENKLRSEELADKPAFESHLSKYRSLMPSLALIFHLIDIADDTYGSNGSSRVGLNSAKLSAAWCEFLEQHARKVYATEICAKEAVAYSLDEKIRQGDVTDGMTVREIYFKGWTGLTAKEDVIKAVDILQGCNRARVEKISTGGAPSTIIKINPSLLEADNDE